MLAGFLPLGGFYVNLTGRASSGAPYTPSGRDIGFVVRNSARMPWTYIVDTEIGREFDLLGLIMTAYVEILNLTDHRNVLYVYPDTGLPDASFVSTTSSEEYIKDPSNFGPPRQMRIGLEIRF